jgi:MFS family permease
MLRQPIFWVSMPLYILGLILPVHGKEIGATVVEIGLFFSAFSIMTVLLRPTIGWAVDHYGRRKFFIAGLFVYAFAMIGFIFAQQVWAVLVVRALQGVASSLVWISVSAMIADKSGERQRGYSFGWLTQISTRGSIIGAVIGFTLLNPYWMIDEGNVGWGSWELVFGIYAIASLYAGVYAWRHVPETMSIRRSRQRGSISWSLPWVLLLLVTLVTGAAWAMVSPILIVFLQDRLQLGLDMISLAFLPAALVWAFLPAHVGRMADRVGRKPLMVSGLLMAAITSFVIPWTSSLLGLAVVWWLQEACYAAGDPAEQALVADLTGGDQRGRAYGLYIMAADLGAAIGPLGGAWLYEHINQAAPFYVNGGALIVCALVVAAFMKFPNAVQSEKVCSPSSN